MRGRTAGFTLLEVMVAVAILALALTAIFSSEAGSIEAARRAHAMSTATVLARCKMSELEESLDRDGLPAIEAHGSDGCCSNAEQTGFRCDWKVERVVLPDSLDGEPNEDSARGKPDAAPKREGSPRPKLEKSEVAPKDDASLRTWLSQSTSSGDIFSELALQYAYPILKPAIEEQVRRATVTVRWKDGTRSRSFDVAAFFVAEPTTGVGLPNSPPTGGARS